MESESAKMSLGFFLALAVEEQSILCSIGCLKPAESTVAKKKERTSGGKLKTDKRFFCLSSLVPHIASILLLNAPL